MEFEVFWETLNHKPQDEFELKSLVETAFHTGYEYGKTEKFPSDAERYRWLKWYLREKESISISNNGNRFGFMLHGAMLSQIVNSKISLDDLFDKIIKNNPEEPI